MTAADTNKIINKISKDNTWIRGDVFISCCAVLVLTVGLYFAQESKIDRLSTKQGNIVESLRIMGEAQKASTAVQNAGLESIGKKLDSLITSQIISSTLSQVRYRNRWSSAMDADSMDVIFDILTRIDPSIKRSDMPDHHKIQLRYPEGNLTSDWEQTR